MQRQMQLSGAEANALDDAIEAAGERLSSPPVVVMPEGDEDYGTLLWEKPHIPDVLLLIAALQVGVTEVDAPQYIAASEALIRQLTSWLP